MSVIATELHAEFLDGLPPRVQGMAEAILVEWERAVGAVPELARLATEDVEQLAALDAVEREQALRRRWTRLHDAPAPAVELTGRPVRVAARRIVAAR
jgi:hypothetical protein